MGTAQLAFEGVLPEVIVCACATESHVTGSKKKLSRKLSTSNGIKVEIR